MSENSSSSMGGGGAAVAAESDGDEGDDESSSSASSVQFLTQFREQWRQELELNSKRDTQTSDYDPKSQREVKDDVRATEKAKLLFMQGSHAEEKGYLYEAVKFYRQAVQLVPDIEFQVCQSENTSRTSNNSSALVESEGVELVDLLGRFQKIISQDESLCQPEYEQKMTHISVLPMEIILYIFKWVISAELDMRSLEQISLVCRGFYLCARDSELWRLACYRVWGVHTGMSGKYCSWRNMFIQRTRLRYNGAYISKTTYVRHGENSFQDQFYRPWHVVEYFRYLRFFPDGVILMLTTPDDPRSALTQLSHRSPRHSAVLVGRYCLHARSVMAVLKRPSCSDAAPMLQRYYKRHRIHAANEDTGEQTFHIELQVKDYKQKANYKLKWTHYAIHTLYKNGNENTSDFDLIQNKFPPFWFSRVKSYTAESVTPLQ